MKAGLFKSQSPESLVSIGIFLMRFFRKNFPDSWKPESLGRIFRSEMCQEKVKMSCQQLEFYQTKSDSTCTVAILNLLIIQEGYFLTSPFTNLTSLAKNLPMSNTPMRAGEKNILMLCTV